MDSTECPKCGAPRKPGFVYCPFCQSAYSAEVLNTAITCHQCKTMSAAGQQKCVSCGTWIVVQCVFCGALSAYTQTACASCGELFAGAPERKARMDAEGIPYGSAARQDEEEEDEGSEDEVEGEKGWRWCSQCDVLFYDSEEGGKCPATEGQHDSSDSQDYMLMHDESYEGESGWKWCKKCNALYYATKEEGTCAAGGEHDGEDGPDYRMPKGEEVDGCSGGWRWCWRCHCMFLGKDGDGVCFAGEEGEGHGAGDDKYCVPFDFSEDDE
jgi:hypothetical protein